MKGWVCALRYSILSCHDEGNSSVYTLIVLVLHEYSELLKILAVF